MTTLITTKEGYGTEEAEETYNYSDEEREVLFPEGQFENTSICLLIDKASFSEVEYAMFEESLTKYLSDKNSKEVLRLINDTKESMVDEFDENCKYNSIAGFDGSKRYSVYHRVLLILYGRLWQVFVKENTDYTKIDNESKVGIMDYIGAEIM